MDAPLAPPAGALLVRIPIARATDLAALPRVPAPHRVTVSVSAPTLRHDPAALAELGYDHRGTHVTQGRLASAPGHALLLVRAPLLDGQPDWARAILGRADKAWDCDLGPVRLALAAALDSHLGG